MGRGYVDQDLVVGRDQVAPVMGALGIPGVATSAKKRSATRPAGSGVVADPVRGSRYAWAHGGQGRTRSRPAPALGSHGAAKGGARATPPGPDDR